MILKMLKNVWRRKIIEKDLSENSKWNSSFIREKTANRSSNRGKFFAAPTPNDKLVRSETRKWDERKDFSAWEFAREAVCCCCCCWRKGKWMGRLSASMISGFVFSSSKKNWRVPADLDFRCRWSKICRLGSWSRPVSILLFTLTFFFVRWSIEFDWRSILIDAKTRVFCPSVRLALLWDQRSTFIVEFVCKSRCLW